MQNTLADQEDSSESYEVISEYVYVIDYGDKHTFKIGCTQKKPEERLKAFTSIVMPSAYNPQLILSSEVKNARDLERILHRRFEDNRDQGEWFFLTYYELIDLYRALSALGDIKVYDRWYEIFDEKAAAYFSDLASGFPYKPFFSKKEKEQWRADHTHVFDWFMKTKNTEVQ